jgi:hypothetical protein
MSGGRGRGRGGYKPPTGAQLMLQRSAQESGLDERNLKSIQDLTKPTLFPDHLWHSSEGQKRGAMADAVVSEQQQLAGINAPVVPIVQPKRTPSEIYKIRKAREFQHHMHLSPFYLRPSLEVDVVRHVAPSNKRARTEMTKACDKTVMEHLGTVATPRFVPPELLMPKGPPKRAGKSANGGAIGPGGVLLDDDMEEKGEGEEGGEDADEYLEPEEDEDEGEDYAKDYYASDNDSDGGGGDGDGEPTF